MLVNMSVASSEPTVSPTPTLDHLLDQHLSQLLSDLQLLIPYDVGAAWLGHDDRPLMRMVVPAGAVTPANVLRRHLVFQTTAEAVRIADLFIDEGVNSQGLRCWLGVPLIMDGRRRGWVELFSTQPNLFTDGDLRRVELVVRHAATALAHLEQSVHTRNELHAQRDLLNHLEQALLAPTLHTTLHRLLGGVATSSHAIAATLMLPVELSYALGLQQIASDVPVARHCEHNELVTSVARWSHSHYPPAEAKLYDFDVQSLAPTTSRAGAVFPCVHEDESVGWVALQYATDQPLHVVDPASLRQVMAVVTAVLVWLREQVQREQQAQQSVRMLVQHAHQQRSSAITDLMAGLAHELNNPLSSVLGLTALLQRDPTLSDETRADVESINAETSRIHEFVKRLSNFGQLTSSTKVPVKLNEVVGDALTVLSGLAQQRNIAVKSTLAEESPVVLANRSQLQQVCLDLLSNALEALETSDAPEIQIDVHAEGEWAVLRIVDNGYGIPEDVRDRIWMPGFTTKTAGGTRRGLGIGLPMALDIVRQHWGTMSVTSQIWQGSCFTVRLPLI